MKNSKLCFIGMLMTTLATLSVVILYLKLGHVETPMLLFFVIVCIGIYLTLSSIDRKQFGEWVIKCWKLRKTAIMVTYETTDLPYSSKGPRREGVLIKTGFFQSWLWGQCFVFVHPRGAVHLDPVNVEASQ